MPMQPGSVLEVDFFRGDAALVRILREVLLWLACCCGDEGMDVVGCLNVLGWFLRLDSVATMGGVARCAL